MDWANSYDKGGLFEVDDLPKTSAGVLCMSQSMLIFFAVHVRTWINEKRRWVRILRSKEENVGIALVPPELSTGRLTYRLYMCSYLQNESLHLIVKERGTAMINVKSSWNIKYLR